MGTRNTIKLTEAEWADIYNKIARRYMSTPSVLLIREKMKSTLGFVSRRHREYDEQTGYTYSIHLDFYSEEAMTMFRLTYL